MAADRFANAEAVYLKDLEDYPRNGWSMSGLVKALAAQGKTEAAAEMQAKLDIVWAKADVDIEGSRL